jgi:hypothetical protein
MKEFRLLRFRFTTFGLVTLIIFAELIKVPKEKDGKVNAEIDNSHATEK